MVLLRADSLARAKHKPAGRTTRMIILMGRMAQDDGSWLKAEGMAEKRAITGKRFWWVHDLTPT